LANIDDDLDQVLRSGAGRRFIMDLISCIQGPISLQSGSEATAYQLGYANFAREIDERCKKVNLQCWLLMHREANETDAEPQREDD
jgi:hypothetical protein